MAQLHQLSLGGHSNVYVRGLPLEAAEDHLERMFQPFGTVQSVRIFRSNQKPTKAPFAFVKLGSVLEAEAAISALNGFNLGGEVIEVRLADNDAGTSTSDRTPPASDNIYCKNLPAGFGDNELRQLFSPFGTVIMCRVLHQGDATGQGGAALVRLTSADDASRAIHALQGHRVMGALHPLIIRFADNAEIKAKKQAKQGMPPGQGQGMPPGLQHVMQQHQQQQAPSAALMRHNPYGSLTNSSGASIPASASSPSFGHFAAPSMPGYYSALSTPPLPLPSSSGYGAANGNSIFGGSDYSLAGPGLHGNSAVGSLGGPGAGVPPAVSAMAVASLYVRNLPVDADKLFLYEKFAPFGAILSVKILTDEQGVSRGVGFVNFSDTVCAAKAAAALHNLPMGDRNLHVAFQTHHKT